MADAFGPTLSGSFNFAGAILKSIHLRRRMKRWSRADLLRWQDKKLRRLVRMAYKKSAFYRELYDQAGVDISNFVLEDLPTVDKTMLMSNFDRVMNVRGLAFAFSKLPGVLPRREPCRAPNLG